MTVTPRLKARQPADRQQHDGGGITSSDMPISQGTLNIEGRRSERRRLIELQNVPPSQRRRFHRPGIFQRDVQRRRQYLNAAGNITNSLLSITARDLKAPRLHDGSDLRIPPE
ncbi:MAG: hypothetical protein ACLRPT_01295 [Akkermansia muciniphila]